MKYGKVYNWNLVEIMKMIMLSSNHYDFLRTKGRSGDQNYNGKQIPIQIQIQISRAAKTITEECIHSKIFLLFKTQCKTII